MIGFRSSQDTYDRLEEFVHMTGLTKEQTVAKGLDLLEQDAGIRKLSAAWTKFLEARKAAGLDETDPTPRRGRPPGKQSQ